MQRGRIREGLKGMTKGNQNYAQLEAQSLQSRPARKRTNEAGSVLGTQHYEEELENPNNINKRQTEEHGVGGKKKRGPSRRNQRGRAIRKKKKKTKEKGGGVQYRGGRRPRQEVYGC